MKTYKNLIRTRNMYGMAQKGSKKGYTAANMALVRPSLVDVARTEHSYIQ
jgi:hypothetical protein